MEEHEDISYKTLRKLQQGERISSVLTKIHVNFYQELSSYINTLERSVENEKNPLKLKLFTDEIFNTKKIATNIYELREKKIVQAALATVRGATPDLSNIVEIEKKLYDSLVAQIKISRKEILEKPYHVNSKKQTSSSISSNQQKTNPDAHQIVRVLENTPEFIGTDEKTYLLRKEDVISLPNEMLAPLLKRGVVKRIK